MLSFSLDRLRLVDTLGQTARECSDSSLDEHFTQTYGIFAGKPTHSAVLRFTPSAARWVADEQGRLNNKGEVKKCWVPLIKEDEQIEWLNA